MTKITYENMVIYKKHLYSRQIRFNPLSWKSIRLIHLCLLGAIVVFMICGCHKDSRSKPVAIVDGTKISIGEYNEILTKELDESTDKSSLTPEEYDLLKEEVLNNIIDEKIMLLRAKGLAITVSDAELMKKVEEIKKSYLDEGFEKIIEEQKVNYNLWKEELRKRMILEKLIVSDVNSKITVAEYEAMAYYKAHRRMYTPETRVHVAQIVVRDHEKAEAILKRLKNSEDFGKVAREESIGPEAAKGGDLGFVSQGVMPEEIDAAIYSLSSGEISPVIKSLYGYHIFKVIGKSEKAKSKWPDIKEQVISDFRKKKEEQAYLLWLNDLRSKAVIKIDRELLKKEAVSLNNKTE